MSDSTSRSPQIPSSDNPRRLASFGRRQGRKLRAGKRSLVDELLPKLAVKLPLDPKKEWWLEIGFGGGEHLAHQAALYPHVGMIGCEPYINGTGDLLKKVAAGNISNVSIHPDDARPLIDKLPDASLSRVFILYPDPWPKTRHHKRRIISTEMLDSLARVMKPGAELRLATDHADYCTWMLERLLVHPGFTWTAKRCNDWLNPPPDWISTRYEQKALAGRPTYLTFIAS